MDSLYYVNNKRRTKQTVSQVLSSEKLKNIFSYEVLNAGFSDFLHHFDFINELKKIICPTLILAGQNDWICSPQQSKIMAKHIKQSTLKIFKKCSHVISSDANDQYVKTIKQFLQKK